LTLFEVFSVTLDGLLEPALVLSLAALAAESDSTLSSDWRDILFDVPITGDIGGDVGSDVGGEVGVEVGGLTSRQLCLRDFSKLREAGVRAGAEEDVGVVLLPP